MLVTTALLTWTFISTIEWRAFGVDIAASAIYLVNWRLADRSVDYLAEDIGSSPVQHFWSLAVEEQFYVVWPLLLLAIAWGIRRYRWRVRRAMATGLALVVVPSLAWSIHLTNESPSVAFLVTTTRLWELAAGALVAVAVHRLAKTPRPLAAVGAWTGLAVVLVGSLTVDASAPWPGAAALIPVLGTAAVIAFGPAATTRGPALLLRLPPLQWVGKLSYSLYLWHWPLLIVATAHWGDLSVRRAVAITLIAFIPAWLAYTLVENPVRRLPIMSQAPRLTLATGMALTAVTVVTGATLVQAGTNSENTRTTADRALGAQVLGDDPIGSPHGLPVDQVSGMTPLPIDAAEDIPITYADGCQITFSSAEPVICEYGHADGPITVALVGDSKMNQWTSAFAEIADRRGWRLLTVFKSSCAFADVAIVVRQEIFEECAHWNQAARDELISIAPDVVITSQGRRSALNDPDDMEAGASPEAMVDGLARRWAELQEAGADVVVMLDNPSPGMHVYECVQEHPNSLTECTFDRSDAVERSASPSQLLAAQLSTDVKVLDVREYICPSDPCAPIIGGVLIYRQGSHITDTYVRSVTPLIEAAIDELGIGK